jgi:hypothetical protein
MLTKEDVEKELYSIGVDHSNRFSRFIDLCINYTLTDEAFNIGLYDSYTETDFLYKYRTIAKATWSNPRVNRKLMLSDEELEVYNNLDDQVTIYRAMTSEEFENKDYGVSWTLKEKIAEDFLSHRRYQHTEIQSMQVDKNDLKAYINCRNEHEVIYINNN